MVIPASKRLAPKKGITAMSATIEIKQSQNGKLTRLYLHDVVIWFSYETPVAYAIPGIAGVVTSDKGWTQTTRRHIGSIPGRRTPIAHEDFERGLMAIMYATTKLYDTTTVREIAELVEQADAARGERIARMGQS